MYDKKSKERTMRYLDKLKKIEFRVKPEEYEEHREMAEKAGYDSMRQFYLDAIKEKIEKIKKNLDV